MKILQVEQKEVYLFRPIKFDTDNYSKFKKTVSSLDKENRQEDGEAIEDEEVHVEDLADGALTAKGKDSTSENVSSRTFKRNKRNETEETELKLLNEITKRLAQKESENASRNERDNEDKLLLSLVK
jgi:hypothetical protein